MKKNHTVIMGCACLLLCVTGVLLFISQKPFAVKEEHAQKEVIVLGFSQIGAESAWRTAHSASIVQAAQDAGVQLMFEDAQQKQEKQINAIRSFISYKVDVIAFTPIVKTGWDNVLQEAKQAGIPVLLSDRMIDTKDESLYAGYIGSDVVEEGRKAGEFLIQKFGSRAPVNVVEISGTENSTSALYRAQGFRQSIASSPNIQIIYTASGDFMRSKGKEQAAIALNRFDDISAFLCHNDAMALGAIESIEQAGLIPGKDIAIVSFDGEQAAVDALKQGKLNCVVECSPMLGESIVKRAIALAKHQPIPKAAYADTVVFREWDDLSDLPPRGY